MSYNENEINSNCVKWEDLNETFNQQILNPEVEKTYFDQREKYPKYFKALEHISSYNDKLEEIGNSINDANKQIDNAIQKEKNNKTESGQSTLKSSGDIELPELGKSNEIIQEQLISETTQEELPIIAEGDMEIVNESEIDIESSVQQPKLDGLSYFGYEIFAREPALFQATSVGAVDPDYLNGPGDEIIVMLWGETQFRQVLTVDREGFLHVVRGGHNSPVTWRRSTYPNDSSS